MLRRFSWRGIGTNLMGDTATHLSARVSDRDAWRMVAYTTIGTACCTIAVVLVNTGIFMRPIGQSLGWSRGDIALALSIGALVMALCNPIIGELIDRFGTRPVLIFSLAAQGIATALIPLLAESYGLAGYYVGYALICSLGAGSTVVGYVRLLSGWFSGDLQASRGLALGCCSSGVVLGAALTGPLAIFLASRYGWQAGYFGLSVIPLLIGLPIALFCIREAPIDVAAHAGALGLDGLTLVQALRSRIFWILALAVLLISSCLQGMAIHIAPYLTDKGMSPHFLATLTMIDFMLGIPARLAAGYLFDRFFAPYVAIGIFALPALGALLMAGNSFLAFDIAGTVLLALGQGAESDFIGYLVSRYFGLAHSGKIFGSIYGIFMVGIAVGPYLFGIIYDSVGSYVIPFVGAAIGLGILCALCGLLPRFPQSSGRAITL